MNNELISGDRRKKQEGKGRGREGRGGEGREEVGGRGKERKKKINRAEIHFIKVSDMETGFQFRSCGDEPAIKLQN